MFFYKQNSSSTEAVTEPKVVSSEAVEMGLTEPKVVSGPSGYVLEDVPHLSDYIPDLPVRRRFTSLLFSNATVLGQ